MSATEAALRDLVVANRILADQGVLDAFGHVSVRHPERPDRYVMSRSRGPATVTREDLFEFTLEGEPVAGEGQTFYAERAIHSRIYAARPDVGSVCHNHAPATIPFGVTDAPLKPIFHMGAVIGDDVPVWDIAADFGETNLLVTTNAMGDSLARALGQRPVILMRGHGSAVIGRTLREAVFRSVYLQRNAELLTIARGFGSVRYLSPAEVELAAAMNAQPLSQDRAWHAWNAQIEH